MTIKILFKMTFKMLTSEIYMRDKRFGRIGGRGQMMRFWGKIQFDIPEGTYRYVLKTIKYMSTDLREGPRLEYRYRNQFGGAKKGQKIWRV